MVDVPVDRFEELVADALDEIPDELWRLVDNVAVVVREGFDGSSLLGLYDGIPLTERDASYDGMVMPDRITIYRQTILRHAHSERTVVDMVRRTVIHEVAHHFGISDPRLRELGW